MASDARVQQVDAVHAGMLKDITAAHEGAIAAAQGRLLQAEALIGQLHAEHAEEIAQCDAEFEEAHASRRAQANKVLPPCLSA